MVYLACASPLATCLGYYKRSPHMEIGREHSIRQVNYRRPPNYTCEAVSRTRARIIIIFEEFVPLLEAHHTI